MCGAAGLLAGMRFVSCKGIGRIHAHECRLAQRMMDRLIGMDGVRVFWGGRSQSGLFSLVIDDMDCEVAAEQLARHDIAVRAGLHCAPLAHQSAGTIGTGTVRFSFSAFNSMEQVEQAAAVLRRIVKNRGKA